MSDYPAAIVAAVAARAGQDAIAVAAEVSDLVLTVKRPIRAEAVRKLWGEAGVLARAYIVAHDPQYGFQQRWHCFAAYDAITRGIFADFDSETQMPRMTVYFDRLKAAGPDGDRVLTDPIIAATLALADVRMTGAELLGRPLTESDIVNIRAELP